MRNGFIGGFGLMLLFAGVFFVQRNRIGKEKKASEAEKQRSDELLLNILPAEVADELRRTGDLIDDVFGRRPVGLRTPGGTERGYRGDRIRLGLISEAGFEYVSAQGWGPGRTMPAPVTAPYAYADEGFPCLLEIPMHGWHENILTRVHPWQSPSQPLSPEAPRTVDEWCAPFATDMLTALESELPYYGPTMHPWSLRRFAPDCRQVEALLRLAREHGFRFARFSEFRDDWLAGRVA